MFRMKIAAFLCSAIILVFHADVIAKENDSFVSEDIKKACVEAGREYNICPELLMAIAEHESNGKPDAVNGDCKGVMQVSEKWHKERMKRLGVDNIFDVNGNVFVAADYLCELFEKYEDAGVVLMFYNGDSNAKKVMDGTKEISEYAENILERSEELERLRGK